MGAVADVAEKIQSYTKKLRTESYEMSFKPFVKQTKRRIYDEFGELLHKGIPQTVAELNLSEKCAFDRFRNDLLEGLVEEAIREEPSVKAIALAEALKVRVITKGPALLGYVLRPLQHFMHSTLKKHPTFRLIGEPVTEDLLNATFKIGLRHGQQWVSGDYKDATNGLLSIISNWICNDVCDQIFQNSDLDEDIQKNLRILFQRSLTEHLVEMEDGSLKPQKNGQLMGSITSFPVLCIANAVLCRLALQKDRQHLNGAYGLRMKVKIPLRHECLLINGDDCVFPATSVGYAEWKRLCYCFNMKPSIGKTYFSSEFLNINSTLYRYFDNGCDTVDRSHLFPEKVFMEGRCSFQLVKYVNFGLLKHMKRSGGLMGTDDVFNRYLNFGKNSKDLINSTPEFCLEDVYRVFLQKFRTIATKCKISLPWFVPNSYGGVGLMPLLHWQPSHLDRQVCSLIRKDNVRFTCFSKDQNWQTHKLILRQFDGCEMEPDSINYDETYSELAVYEFFRLCIENKVASLYSDRTDPKIKELRRAEQFWMKNARSKKLDARIVDPWINDLPMYPVVVTTAEPSATCATP